VPKIALLEYMKVGPRFDHVLSEWAPYREYRLDNVKLFFLMSLNCKLPKAKLERIEDSRSRVWGFPTPLLMRRTAATKV
jgi:hypothetical protein